MLIVKATRYSSGRPYQRIIGSWGLEVKSQESGSSEEKKEITTTERNRNLMLQTLDLVTR